jgi:uncharacterized membrane protein YccC
VLETLAIGGLVLLAISAGAGFVLATLRLRGDHLPAPDPMRDLTNALGVVRQVRELEPATSAGNELELKQTLRAERAAMRADFAEAIEQAEGVSETVQRHRKKAQQVQKRLEEAEQVDQQPDLPIADDLEARRSRLVTELKAQGKL